MVNVGIFFMVFSLILTFSSTFTVEASVMDFCVADTSKPISPAGYSCKNPNNVTADDFFYSLSTKGIPSIFGLGLTTAIVPGFPGVNGLDISMYRLDFEIGGVVPFHTHPRASEVVVLIEGKVLVGFISSDTNNVYMKTIKPGEVFVIPQGLLHFQVNVGDVPALEYATFNSASPGLQVTSMALFGNDLVTDIIRKTTLIKEEEIQRLKRIFRGTN